MEAAQCPKRDVLESGGNLGDMLVDSASAVIGYSLSLFSVPLAFVSVEEQSFELQREGIWMPVSCV